MKYFSMFSGIGGFELGIQDAYRSEIGRGEADSQGTEGQGLLTEAGEDTRAEEGRISPSITNITNEGPSCVGYSEIDRYAISVYERNFNGHRNYGDATTINPATLPDFDLLVGGFPCQAFSIAGKRGGFTDTRGTLFFDIARILAVKRPRHLVLENVKGLLSHDGGKTFTTILGVLTSLGYEVEWQVLNSKNHGVPQNRDRTYIVGHLGGCGGRKILPILTGVGRDIEVIGYLNSPSWQKRNESIRRVYSMDGVAPTIPTGTGGGHIPKLAVDLTLRAEGNHRVREDGRVGTLDANYYKGIANQERPGAKIAGRVRRLTPLECERLQAFPDNFTAYGSMGPMTRGMTFLSDTQRYKMCGNAVTVNVVSAVMRKLREHGGI